MTEITFHFNVPDRVEYGCRLLRKAYLSGASIVVVAEPDVLRELDQCLWTFSALEFVPHHRMKAGEQMSTAMLEATPILLADSPEDCPGHGVLINLGASIPQEFERFERFIEVVTGDAEDRQSARSRWKHYAARGYALKDFDLSASGARA